MSNKGQLVKKMLMVKLNISYDTGYRNSSEMKELIEGTKNVSSSAIRTGITMFDKYQISEFTTAISRARSLYTSETLPWDSRNWRVIPVSAWSKFKDELDTAIENVKEAYEKVFDDGYDELKEEFDDNIKGSLDIEFPDKEDLADKFNIDYDIGQIASCDDIRIQGIDHIERDKIRNDMQKQYQEKMDTGLTELASRLVEASQDIAIRANDPNQKGKKYSKSLSNINKLADTVEALNITGNDAIADACSTIRTQIGTYSAEAIKTTESIRENVLEATTSIRDSLSKVSL